MFFGIEKQGLDSCAFSSCNVRGEGIPDDYNVFGTNFFFFPFIQASDAFGKIFMRRLGITDLLGNEKILHQLTQGRGLEAPTLYRGDSVGAKLECAAVGLPASLGEHMFESVEAEISQLMFAIPAVKGIEFGSGFDFCRMYGSEANDAYAYENGKVVTKTNHCGGIVGGMTTGMPVTFSLALKPTPSIYLEQDSVNLAKKCNTTHKITGRHDPCIVPRAVPVVEAAAAIAIFDAILS